MIRLKYCFIGLSIIIIIGFMGTYMKKQICKRFHNKHICDESYAAGVLKNALSIQGDIAVQQLKGGFSGAPLFVATTASSTYVLRFLEHKSPDERKREVAILQIASNEGYGPHIYFVSPAKDVIIMEFLTNQFIMPEIVQSDMLYKMLAQLLQKIHRGPQFEKIEDRDMFYVLSVIIKDLKNMGSSAIPFDEIKRIIEAIHETLAFYPDIAPCHNDLHPSNLIFLGDKFKAIDYERAAQGNPYFDIAMVAYAYCSNSSCEKKLLTFYLERQPSEIELSKLLLMKQIAWLYCAVCFLHMVPSLLDQYQTLVVPSYDDFMKGMFDLEKSENKLKFAKVLINQVIASFQSDEIENAVKLLQIKN